MFNPNNVFESFFDSVVIPVTTEDGSFISPEDLAAHFNKVFGTPQIIDFNCCADDELLNNVHEEALRENALRNLENAHRRDVDEAHAEALLEDAAREGSEDIYEYIMNRLEESAMRLLSMGRHPSSNPLPWGVYRGYTNIENAEPVFFNPLKTVFEDGQELEEDTPFLDVDYFGTLIEDRNKSVFMLDEAADGSARWFAWGDRTPSQPMFPVRLLRVMQG